MTAYTTIPDTDIAQDKPIKAETGLALRDNALAIQEGNASAPSIYVALAAKLVANGLGSLAFAFSTGPDVGFGFTVAGSSLRPVGAARAVTVSNGGSGTVAPSFDNSAQLNGTWKCLGHFDSSSSVTVGGPAPQMSVTIYGATLWQRIA